MKIIDTTDKKYLGLNLNNKEISKGKAVQFPDGFVFEIEKIFIQNDKMVLSNSNYIIICEGE